MDVVLVGSLEGGEHFDDICWLIWGWRALWWYLRMGTNTRAKWTQSCQSDTEIFQMVMLKHVVEQDIYLSQTIQKK